MRRIGADDNEIAARVKASYASAGKQNPLLSVAVLLFCGVFVAGFALGVVAAVAVYVHWLLELVTIVWRAT